MKRHPALAPLLRDHHHALVMARRLRNADEHDALDAARAFLEHWEQEHELFPLVERTLPEPALSAGGEQLRDAGA